MSPPSDDNHPKGVSNETQSIGSEVPFTVTFPQEHDSNPLRQNEECAEVQTGKKKQQFRIHDYSSMYALPGLYE